jgi:dienelactone hydrolase
LTVTLIVSTAIFFYSQHFSGQNIVKISASAQSPKGFPWDIELLNQPPKVKWLDNTGKIKSFYYEGLPYKGKTTDVFAYYATPGSISGDLSKDQDLPGIVIVHGGCQAASQSVVNLWAQRGYAAISMDLDGHGPDLLRLKNGGPPAEAYMSYDWNYHAVAKIILAHSLMLSFSEIDKSRSAITGLSVGGHLTCIVAGIDDRFKAAASVYGTGFIYEKGFFKQWYQERLSPEEQRLWRDLIDPSNYLGNITCPFLFAGNPNDNFYPLEIRIKSYELLKGPFYLYNDPDLPHSNIGHSLYILESFLGQYLKAGSALPVLQKPEKKGDKLYVRSSDLQKNHSAYVYFTTDAEPSDSRKWQIYPARIDQDGIVADLPPDNTTACFVNYLVDDHVMLSSKVLILDNSFLQ